MKLSTLAAILLVACTFGLAQTAQTAPTAHKSCDDLKAEIAKKLEAKNVVGYSLEIVDKGKATEGKIVGSCDGGTKDIVYSRTAAPAEKPAEAKKAQ